MLDARRRPFLPASQSLRLHPVEQVYTMHDLTQRSTQGKLLEALCIGTAAIVAAVSNVAFEGNIISLPKHESGPGALQEKILAIQEGMDEYQTVDSR